MRVAITGGTGFIGKRLIARHLSMGDEVVYLTRKQPEFASAAKPYMGDLLSPIAELVKFTKNVDVLYHCAAEIREVEKMQSTNVEGTKNLIEAAKGSVGRWIQLSSTGVYGQSTHRVVTENSPLSPRNPYEISKSESDKLVLQAAEQHGFDSFVLRPSNVYGNDMPNQSIFSLIKMVDKGLFFYIGEKKAIANYVHVENVVDALVLCAKEANKKPDTYIVSDSCDLEVFIKYIAIALNKKVPKIRISEPLVRRITWGMSKFTFSPLTSARIDALTNTTSYDIQKIQTELNFKNNILMQDGITQLVHYWKSKHTS